MATIDNATTADTALLRPRPRPEIIAHAVDRPQRGWVSWLTTTDHKRIGIMYLVTRSCSSSWAASRRC